MKTPLAQFPPLQSAPTSLASSSNRQRAGGPCWSTGVPLLRPPKVRSSGASQSAPDAGDDQTCSTSPRHRSAQLVNAPFTCQLNRRRSFWDASDPVQHQVGKFVSCCYGGVLNSCDLFENYCCCYFFSLLELCGRYLGPKSSVVSSF